MATTFSSRAAEIRRRTLLVLVAGVPLLFVRSALDPINVPKLALLMAGLSVVVALRVAEILQGESTEGLKRLAVPAVAVVAPLAIAWTFSSYKGWALFGHYPRFTGLIPYAVLALYGVMLADAFGGHALSVAWALLIAGGVAGAYAVIQFLGLDPLSWTIKGTEQDVVASTLGNPNFVGAFLGIVLVVGAAVVVNDAERRRWSIALLLLVGAGWLAARSEAGWAGAIAGLGIAGGIVLSSRWRVARIVGVVFGGALLVAVIGVVIAAIAQGPEGSLPDTAERRADWWQAAASMAADAPIVGHGPSTFALEHPRYRTLNDVRQVGRDITDDPHSIFLSFLAGAGVLGLVGLLLAIAWIVRRGVTLDADNVIGAGFFGAFCAYLIQASISIDTVALRAAMWTAVAGMVASTLPDERRAASRTSKKKGRARPAPIRNLPGVVAAFVVAVVAIAASARFLTADTRVRRANLVLSAGDVTTGQALFQGALDRRNDIEYRQLYGNTLGGLAIGAAESRNEEPARQLLDEAREAFSFIEEVPDVGAIADLADILGELSSVDPSAGEDALELYARAAELDPLNPHRLEDAADMALGLEEFDVVVDLIEGHRLLQESPALQGQLALAYAHLGRDQDARALAERALSQLEYQAQAELALQLLEGD